MKTNNQPPLNGLRNWWWEIDRSLFISLLLLIVVGLFLNISTSPFLAKKLHVGNFVFFQRHIIYAVASLAIIIVFSNFSKQNVLLFSLIFVVLLIILLGAVPFLGHVVKGARRWLNVGGLSIQPSELLKAPFCIVSAWLLNQWVKQKFENGFLLSLGLLLFVCVLLLLQPDVGMTVLITATWLSQIFVSGFSFMIIGLFLLSATAILGVAYLLFPHVQNRLNVFLSLTPQDKYGIHYQTQKALKAFQEGGVWGKGAGEGIIKKHIPDAHADFIFSVAGEEFGFLFCGFIILVYAFIFWRCMSRLNRMENIFAKIALAGLSISFSLQAVINIASNLQLIPTKGMPLPFLSYGGSSMISAAILSGFVLALTKRRSEI